MTEEKSMCWCCGINGDKELTDHHAIPVAMKPIKNVKISLCHECHTALNLYYIQSYGDNSDNPSNVPAIISKSKQRIKNNYETKYKNDLKRITEQLIYAKNRVKELEESMGRTL